MIVFGQQIKTFQHIIRLYLIVGTVLVVTSESHNHEDARNLPVRH